MTEKELYKTIDSFSGSEYFNIHSIIDSYIKKARENKEDIGKNIIADYIAFSLFPNHNGISNWGTHYGPFATFNNLDGSCTENPGKSHITNEVIHYWKARVKNTKNNLIKFRYLDIIYDLQFEITCEKIELTTVQELLNTGILCIDKKLFTSLDGKYALKRIVDIAIQYNQHDLIKNNLIHLIIAYEKEISEDEKPGLWGFSYDYLVENKKIPLEKSIETDIINVLEERINRNSNPYIVENCADRLLKYYQSKGNHCELLKILKHLENSYKNHEYSNSNGLLKSNYYQELIRKYSYYQNFPSIRIERDRIINEFQKISKEILDSFQEFSTSFTITDEEMNNYLNFFFEDKRKIIPRIVLNQAVKLDETKNQLSELVNDFPLQYIINKQYTDINGLPIHNYGDIHEDYDSHLYSLISQNLHFGSIFLDKIFEKLMGEFTKETLAQELLKCPIFLDEDKCIIPKIIENYYAGNYFEMNHIAIPFIEMSFRNLCELNGYTVIVYKDGRFELKSLDSLINNGIIKSVFKERGDDFIAYFRIVLTLKTGWNLRNNLAHGINQNYFFSKKVADRLLHILLCLSLIRTQ